jgi:chemotaxis protein CheC
MADTYTEIELDALREVANIGSGTAATALSSMIGKPVNLTVPTAIALPLLDAVEQAGPGEMVVTTVAIRVHGDLQALVLMVMQPGTVETLCRLLNVDVATTVGSSALAEVGNILANSYLRALGLMTGLALDPTPPDLINDMLGAVLTSALLMDGDRDQVLLLESSLSVDGEECSPSFILIPSEGGVEPILARIGAGA